MGIWHEQRLMNLEEYWKLDKEIYGLSMTYCYDTIPREIAWPLTRIFSYIMISIQAHYNINDGFVIDNLNQLEMYDFNERFQMVVEGFFKGIMPKNEHFQLVNPLLIEQAK